jgi:MOSC domain-containing protein YiiM
VPGNPIELLAAGLYPDGMANLQSVNLGVIRPAESDNGVSAIDKRPVDRPVMVRDPGPKGNGDGGLVGDSIGDARHHGGHDQAVYAYAREDLDVWQDDLGVELDCGVFGENLTTTGLDVTGARIGERWRIGDRVVVQVTLPRIPCRTFAGWMRRHGWVKTFTQRGAPGAYLRVVEPGWIHAGDPVVVEHRPDHDVTIGLVFRALTTEPDLLPRLLEADELPDDAKDRARRRLTFDVLS